MNHRKLKNDLCTRNTRLKRELYQFRLHRNDRGEETAVPCPYNIMLGRDTALPSPNFS